MDISPTEFRAIRKTALGLTQWEMADVLGITRAHIQNLERGTEIPRKYSLAMLYLKEHAAEVVGVMGAREVTA